MSLVKSLWRSALDRPKTAIVLLALAALLPGLGGGYLWDRDETWYAACALDMVRSGDWLVPGAGTKVFLEKPPLAYWFMAAAFKAVGFSEFAARLPSALLGVGTLLVVYGLTARALSRRAGLIAAGVLFSSLHFGVLTRAVMTDPALVLAISATCACFWMMEKEPAESVPYWSWCLLGGIALGAALLAKGPIGLQPGLVVVLYMALRRDFSFFKRAHVRILVGLAVAFIIALPWYYLVWRRVGQEFVDEFVIKRNIGYATTPMQGHSGPFWYYVPVLIVGMMPWTFFLLSLPWNRRTLDRFDLFLISWAAVPFVIFSAIATKLPHSIAPAIPPLAILAAREVEWRLGEGREGLRLIRFGFQFWVAVGVFFLVASVALSVVFEDVPVLAFVVPGVILTAGFAIGARSARREEDLGRGCWECGLTVTLFLLWTACVSLAQLSRIQVLPRAVIEATARAKSVDGEATKDELLCYHFFEPSVFLYSQGVMERGNDPEVEALLAAAPATSPVYVVGREREFGALTALLNKSGRRYRVENFDALKVRFASLQERFRASKRYRIRLVEVSPPQ